MSAQTVHRRGLEYNEPRMLDLEPYIISMADSGDQSSRRCFSMRCTLPGSASSESGAGCTLTEWLRRRKVDRIMPVATVEIPGMSRLTYIRDEIKLLIK